MILFTKLEKRSIKESSGKGFEPVAVVPAFHCRDTVGRVVTGLFRHVQRVIVVDDGSRDGTAEEAKRAGAAVIIRQQNGGKGSAVREGLKLALETGATHIAFVDADGQHDPDDLPGLIAAAREGADFVIGSRLRNASSMPRKNFWTNAIGDRVLSRMTGLEIEDGQSGYRVVAAALVRSLPLVSRRYSIENEILVKASPFIRRLAIVPIKTIYGNERRHYRPFLDTWVTCWLTVHYKTLGNSGS